MSQNKEKVFASPREVFQTYFPNKMNERESVPDEGYVSSSRDLVSKLAEEFAANLQKKSHR